MEPGAHNSDLLTVSGQGSTIAWESTKPEYKGVYPSAWVPGSTLVKLHSGMFLWNFIAEERSHAQIGVGVMLLQDIGPDWGFFGYLGASSTRGWHHLT